MYARIPDYAQRIALPGCAERIALIALRRLFHRFALLPAALAGHRHAGTFRVRTLFVFRSRHILFPDSVSST
jgi:hypothetical protein